MSAPGFDPHPIIHIAAETAPRLARRSRTVAITALAAVVSGIAWAVALVPAFAGFAFAVGAAVGWCVWIEKHPETGNRNGLPTYRRALEGRG